MPRELLGARWTTARLDAFYEQLVSRDYLRRPEDIPTGTERRSAARGGSVILGAATLVELADSPGHLVICGDTEYWCIGGGKAGAPERVLEHLGITREEGVHPIVGGRKIVWQAAFRLFNLHTRETLESVCWTNSELGLQGSDLRAAKSWLQAHLQRGIKVYNFSRGADNTVIEWCAGQPYDTVARDARQLELLVTTIYEKMGAPCTQDLKRGSRTRPGTAGVGLADAAWWRAMRPAADKDLPDADGEPHMAPCDAHDLAQQLASLWLMMTTTDGNSQNPKA